MPSRALFPVHVISVPTSLLGNLVDEMCSSVDDAIAGWYPGHAATQQAPPHPQQCALPDLDKGLGEGPSSEAFVDSSALTSRALFPFRASFEVAPARLQGWDRWGDEPAFELEENEYDYSVVMSAGPSSSNAPPDCSTSVLFQHHAPSQPSYYQHRWSLETDSLAASYHPYFSHPEILHKSRPMCPHYHYDKPLSSSARGSNSPRSATRASPSSCSEGGSNGKERKETTERKKITPWSSEEHEVFLEVRCPPPCRDRACDVLTITTPRGGQGIEKFRTTNADAVGRNGEASVGLGVGVAEMISLMIGTRDAAQVCCCLPARALCCATASLTHMSSCHQVRSHAQKHFQRLRRERKADKPEN